MNTDTKQNINANIYIRTNADTSVNNRAYLHFHAGINSTPILMGLLYTNNGATGRKRAPGGAGGMQQCQNHWQAWHILQRAQSRRSGRKEEKFREKSGKLRCRCGFARTQAFKHAWRGIFCRARSPGGRAGSRKNCKQNPANCAAAVLLRARRRFSMGVWT